MIWDFIRDFFVQYFFGGIDSNGVYYGALTGRFCEPNDMNYYESYNETLFVNIGSMVDNGSDSVVSYMCFGDWLSTTATIITLVIILVAIGLFIRWLFRLVSGLITFRG